MMDDIRKWMDEQMRSGGPEGFTLADPDRVDTSMAREAVERGWLIEHNIYTGTSAFEITEMGRAFLEAIDIVSAPTPPSSTPGTS